MKFKMFEEDTLVSLENAVNAWLLTGTFYTYSQSCCMTPDGEGGECYCLQLFYLEK